MENLGQRNAYIPQETSKSIQVPGVTLFGGYAGFLFILRGYYD